MSKALLPARMTISWVQSVFSSVFVAVVLVGGDWKVSDAKAATTAELAGFNGLATVDVPASSEGVPGIEAPTSRSTPGAPGTKEPELANPVSEAPVFVEVASGVPGIKGVPAGVPGTKEIAAPGSTKGVPGMKDPTVLQQKLVRPASGSRAAPRGTIPATSERKPRSKRQIPAPVRPSTPGVYFFPKPLYPYNASLKRRVDLGHYCGASLIGPRHVLTAAHCVTSATLGDPSPYIVVGAALVDQVSGDGVQVFKTKKITLHPTYTQQEYPDLAILELDGVADTPPVGLPASSDHFPRPNQVLTIMGWGRVGPSSALADVVQVTEVDYLPSRSCSLKLERNIRPDELCSGGEGAGSCRGDGGGPIVIPGASGSEDVLIGVVGADNSCGSTGLLDVDTRVAPYLHWIKETIGS